MRKRTTLALVILGAALLVILPAITVGQFQFQGSKGKGKGGGGFGSDPGRTFDFISRGNPYIVIAEQRFMKDQLLQYAQENGITNGQLTRQQYIDFSENFKNKLSAGNPAQPGGGKGPGFGAAPGGFGGGAPGDFGGKKFGGPQPPGGMSRTEAMADPTVLNKWIEDEFNRRDINGDRKLSPDEMPQSLRSALTRYDRNNDGFIDITEYREYFMARLSGIEDSKGGIASIIIEENELDLKPTVLRFGKLPKNLPAWFIELDQDKDGQVALYEWRAGKKNLDEFKQWDLNDDGFITPEEALRQQDVIAKSGVNSPGTSVASSGDRPTFGGRRTGFGGPPSGDGSTGGFGGFGKGKKGGGKGKNSGGGGNTDGN